MTHPTDDEIMELAGSWFHTGENQKRDDGYYYRSLGTPSNVRGSDLIEFARALLAEQVWIEFYKAEDAPSDAARDVLAERQRQISKEGWTIHHDDEHDTGEMADAAAVYALRASGHFESGVPTYGPWAASDYKPKDKRTDLVRAAALLLAEIERIDRAAIAQERKA